VIKLEQLKRALIEERHRSNDYAEQISVLQKQLQAKQAKIDALMLEFCPEVITTEQFENWAKHQVKNPDD